MVWPVKAEGSKADAPNPLHCLTGQTRTALTASTAPTAYLTACSTLGP